jgi:tellurite resistance-related uncharacterized protein
MPKDPSLLRNGAIGATSSDRLNPPAELPPGLEIYARTPDFTQRTMPAELTSRHVLAEDVWGVLHVLDGTIVFHDMGDFTTHLVPAGGRLIIEPELVHRLEPCGHARFFIELHIPQDKIRATIPSGSC